MPLSEPLGSIYDSIARAWRGRFVIARIRKPTGKHILCTYASTVDRFIPVTKPLVDAMIQESSVTVDQLEKVVQKQTMPASQVETRAELVKILLWSISHKGDKIRVTSKDVLDWLNGLFKKFGGDERLGGAPGGMIEALTTLCGEENAAIFTIFHSLKQASLYEAGIPFLTADAGGNLNKVEAKDYHQYCNDRQDDPEARNYPLEYQPGEIAYGATKKQKVHIEEPDRLIATSGYGFYQPDGKVMDGRIPPPIQHIFQFPGLTDRQRDKCVQAVAEKYSHIALSNLQRAPETMWGNIERELDILRDHQVTIHLEISGLGNLNWINDLIPKYICSIGINEDELPQVCDELLGRDRSDVRSYTSLWEVYQDARALAVELGVKRLYAHTHTADLILRQVPVDNSELRQEIEADLYAKSIVAESLKKTIASGPVPDIGLKREGVEVLMNFMAQVVGLADKPVLQWVGDTGALAEAGYFTVEDDYAVAVVPVAWFLGPLSQVLITTGAGDKSSVVSFVQSCFTRSKLHGQP